MSAFIVAVVTVTDQVAFQEYANDINNLVETYDGEYVCRGPVTATLEGQAAAGERVVVIRFPDRKSAEAYISSPTYQSAKAKRLNAGTVTMRLVEA
jgi:uncharacterized protein (DUF1330 family)